MSRSAFGSFSRLEGGSLVLAGAKPWAGVRRRATAAVGAEGESARVIARFVI